MYNLYVFIKKKPNMYLPISSLSLKQESVLFKMSKYTCYIPLSHFGALFIKHSCVYYGYNHCVFDGFPEKYECNFWENGSHLSLRVRSLSIQVFVGTILVSWPLKYTIQRR